MPIVHLVARRNQIHEPEAASIVIDDAPAVICLDQKMVVLICKRPAGIMVGLTGARRRTRLNREPARHAEMGQPDRTVVEADQDVFRSARHILHRAAGEPVRKALGKRESEVGAAQLDPRQPPSLERRP